jgi:hypothetical protein
VISIPIASFLAGALLTILIPLGVLIALAIWYTVFLYRAPDPGLRPAPDTGTGSAPVPPPDATGSEGTSGGGGRIT